ncbi:chaperonin 10-like protein [Flammula alnicola]|nr:chaperonin 10-like protein [Flammula alnicola]
MGVPDLGDIRLEDRVLWPPSSGRVQVKVVSTGLCGSDLHYYTHGRNGDFAVRAPLVLGHEAAGIVTAVAPGVTNFKVGQRVAIEAGISCRACSFCDSGRYNLSAARFPHIDGTLQTHMNHPAHALHPLPDGVSFELASLAEPLSVLIHASRRSVLVFGVGAIGLLACALAKHRGARRVVAVDINPARLEFAKKNGFADDVYCLPAPADQILQKAKDGAMAALSAFDAPDGFDIVFECTGAESAIQMSVFAATTGGRVMLIGMGTRAAYIPISSFALREVDIKGSFRYAGTYPEALALLSSSSSSALESSSSALPGLVAKLVTHRFGLADTRRAFEMLAKGVDERGGLVLKVMVGEGQEGRVD